MEFVYYIDQCRFCFHSAVHHCKSADRVDFYVLDFLTKCEYINRNSERCACKNFGLKDNLRYLESLIR